MTRTYVQDIETSRDAPILREPNREVIRRLADKNKN